MSCSKDINLKALSVTQLKEECEKRSLKKTGKKADLIQRLEDHLEYEDKYEDETIRCICGSNRDEGLMISCDKCL